MKLIQLSPLLFSAALAFSGCAAFGVPETSDPFVKLAQANYLEHAQARPAGAAILMRQAKAICEKRADDYCLAETLKAYGRFMTSGGFNDAKWKATYAQSAYYLDNTVTIDNRMQKGIDYRSRAREIFLKGKKFSEVVNMDHDIASVYWHLGANGDACVWYDRSLEDYSTMIADDPNVPMHFPANFATYQDYVASLKNKLACGK